MPVKKTAKKGGKKKLIKKKGAKEHKAVAPEFKRAAESELLMVKEFFLLQVNDLEARLQRATREGEEATSKYTKLEKVYTQEKDTLENIVEHLKREGTKLQDEVEASHARVVAHEAAMEVKMKSFEQGLRDKFSQQAKKIENLETDVAMRDRKLAALAAFQEREASLGEQVEDMRRQMSEQTEAHKVQLARVEREKLTEMEKLRGQLAQRVEAVAAGFQQQMMAEMPAATKRMLAENVAMNNQIAALTAHAESLATRHEAVVKKGHGVRLDLVTAEAAERTANDQLLRERAAVRDLEARCAELQQQLAETKEREKEMVKEMEVRMAAKEGEVAVAVDAAQRSTIELEDQLSGLRADHVLVQRDYDRAQALLATVQGMLGPSLEAARTSRTALLRSSAEGSPTFITAAADVDGIVASLEGMAQMLGPVPAEAKYEIGKLGFVPRYKSVRNASIQTEESARVLSSTGEPVLSRRASRPSSAHTSSEIRHTRTPPYPYPPSSSSSSLTHAPLSASSPSHPYHSSPSLPLSSSTSIGNALLSGRPTPPGGVFAGIIRRSTEVCSERER